MILNKEQLKEIFNVDYYDGSQIHSRFAYKCFREKILPIGNIIAFRAKMDVTSNLIDQEDVLSKDYIWSDDALNFCWEIPLLNNPFGAVAFQRLFNTQIAQILSKQYLNKPIEVAGDDLICHCEHKQGGIVQLKGKASVSITYTKDNTALGHTAINVSAGKQAPAFAFSTNLSDDKCTQFMQNVIDMFYSITDDLFVASSKVY